MSSCVYRILTADEWARFQTDGKFAGSALDQADGFIHLSAADQVEATLARHFPDRGGLVVAELDVQQLGDAVRWEVSHDGAVFPHLYGILPRIAVRGTRALG